MNIANRIKNAYKGFFFNEINGSTLYPNTGFLFDAEPKFKEIEAKLRLHTVIKNPAFLKVVALQCDLFSLAEIKMKNGDNEIEKDPVLDLFRKPNYFQTKRQFLWDYMFWTMLGGAVLYISKKNNSEKNKAYFLDPANIDLPAELNQYKGMPVLTDATYNKIKKMKVKYRVGEGRVMNFKIEELIFLTDLSNGQGNWFKGYSRVDALYQVVANSQAALGSKKINIDFLRKFIVSGIRKIGDVSKAMMQPKEKKEIDDKLLDEFKSVHTTTTPIEIKRFIEQTGVLESLDKAYLDSYYKIGKMFGIPKDVLEAYESSTFENQEKAKGSHVSYVLQPKADDLTAAIETKFEYEEKEVYFSYAHLPFMQVFEKDRADVEEKKAKTLERLVKAGATFDSASSEVGYQNLEENGEANR